MKLIKRLKTLIKSIFEPTIPKIGSIWYLHGRDWNPFTESQTKVIIHAVKNGWVKYKYTDFDTQFHYDSLRTFYVCWREVKDVQ